MEATAVTKCAPFFNKDLLADREANIFLEN